MSATEAVGQLFDSRPLLGDRAALTARLDDAGYLFFRDLLPRAVVVETRNSVLAVLQQFGWLDQAAPIGEGRLSRDAVDSIPDEELREDIGISNEGYLAVQRLRAVHALPHHPVLYDLFTKLLGEAPFVHPRHIVRVMTAHHSLSPTPPHQDFPLVQGSLMTLTCWFPLGEAPRSLGPLAVLPGSHRHGYLPVRPAAGAGNIEALLCSWEDQWLSSDYRVGDVVVFPSCTVHRALRATDLDHVRISMDVRYQSPSEPIEERSLGPHIDDCSWDEVYRDWPNDDPLRFYWVGSELRRVPFDFALLQEGRRIC